MSEPIYRVSVFDISFSSCADHFERHCWHCQFKLMEH